MIVHIAKKIYGRNYVRVSELSRSFEKTESKVKDRLDDLVDEGVLMKLTSDIYIPAKVPEDEQESAGKEIYSKFSDWRQEVTSKTEVEVSGELVEDESYTIDRQIF